MRIPVLVTVLAACGSDPLSYVPPEAPRRVTLPRPVLETDPWCTGDVSRWRVEAASVTHDGCTGVVAPEIREELVPDTVVRNGWGPFGGSGHVAPLYVDERCESSCDRVQCSTEVGFAYTTYGLTRGGWWDGARLRWSVYVWFVGPTGEGSCTVDAELRLTPIP